MVERTIRFGEHPAVPVIGQGTWYMGENPRCARRRRLHCARASILA